jgi:hypothetical protein
MNRSGLLLIVPFILLLGVPLFAHTPCDEITQLTARVKALEAENETLKQTIAKSRMGSFGVPHGQFVTIEGEYIPRTPLNFKSIADFRVKSVNGRDLPGNVHLHVREHPVINDKSRATKPASGKAPGLLRLKGFQRTEDVGDPYGRTGQSFQVVEVFMIIEVLDEK